MSQKALSSRVRQGDPSFHRYRISVEGQIFLLTELELQSEPDNIFNLKRQTLTNLHSPRMSSDDTHIHADPNLFRLIHAHLQGYEIFPLPPQGIPIGRGIITGISTYRLPSLSKEATLRNLLRDATDFGLTKLAAKVEQEITNQAEVSSGEMVERIKGGDEVATEFVILGSV